MIVFQTIAVAFAMFSAIPLPQPVWNDQNMRYALLAFPLIGGVIGALCAAWAGLADFLTLPELLRGAGFCLLPVLVTGGIHLDGYADTCDALASYGSPQKKLEILSDPHCGAFAVIRLIVYFIAYFSLSVALQPSPIALLCLSAILVLSRTLSGLALTVFPLAKDTGLVHMFSTAADRGRVRNVLIVYAAAALVCLSVFGKISGLLIGALGVGVWIRYYVVSKKQFGGISGDLAGWFLQKAELWMLAALVFFQILGMIS